MAGSTWTVMEALSKYTRYDKRSFILRTESARAVTGRRCPQSGEGEDFLTGQPDFFYENCCNSGTESQKMVSKVGNERPLQGLLTGR